MVAKVVGAKRDARSFKALVPPLPRDEALTARVKAVCGLESVRTSESLVGARQKMFELDMTGNLVVLGRAGNSLAAFADVEFVGLYPENKGEWLRMVVLRPFFEDGRVFVGGSMKQSEPSQPDDGWDGIWTLPNGRRCFRRDIPSDVSTVYPDGWYKDVLLQSRSTMSLYDQAPHTKQANTRLRLVLDRAVTALEKAPPVRQVALGIPDTFVACSGLMDFRFMSGNLDAVRAICELQAQITRTGLWALPGLESLMVSKSAGIIKDVGPTFIGIQYDDGGGEVLRAPTEAVREYLAARATLRGVPKVYPLVQRGEVVPKGTVLWGGAPVDCFATWTSIARAPADVNEQNQQVLLRTWAALTLGRSHEQRYIYPLSFVAPVRASDLYFQTGVQRVVLKDFPARSLRAEGFDVAIDMYTTSQRSHHFRRLREQRAKSLSQAKPVSVPRAESALG